MTYAAHHRDFAPYADCGMASHRDAQAMGGGILRRIVDAIAQSRQRQADREIAGFIARSGGQLTDEVERRMMQRVTTSDWSVRE